MIRTVFWSFVLAGVFILGLGFGRTIAVEDELSSDDVTITSDLGPIQATLPTRTETVTKTVTVPAAKAKAAKRPAASAVPER